jgi:hypothetical protein
VDQGLSDTPNLLKQFNINTYAPTMLVFNESIDRPADIIQVVTRQLTRFDYFSTRQFNLIVK